MIDCALISPGWHECNDRYRLVKSRNPVEVVLLSFPASEAFFNFPSQISRHSLVDRFCFCFPNGIEDAVVMHINQIALLKKSSNLGLSSALLSRRFHVSHLQILPRFSQIMQLRVDQRHTDVCVGVFFRRQRKRLHEGQCRFFELVLFD